MFVKTGNCLFEKKWRHGWRAKKINDKNFVLVSSRTCILPDVYKTRKLSFFVKKWRHGWRIKTVTDKNFVLVSSRTCILPDVYKTRKLSFFVKKWRHGWRIKMTNRQELCSCQLTDVHFWLIAGISSRLGRLLLLLWRLRLRFLG